VQVARVVAWSVSAAELFLTRELLVFAVLLRLVVLLAILDEPALSMVRGPLPVLLEALLLRLLSLSGLELLDNPLFGTRPVLAMAVRRFAVRWIS